MCEEAMNQFYLKNVTCYKYNYDLHNNYNVVYYTLLIFFHLIIIYTHIGII